MAFWLLGERQMKLLDFLILLLESKRPIVESNRRAIGSDRLDFSFADSEG